MNYDRTKQFKDFKVAFNCTEGRLDDDAGTFMISVILFSDKNRKLTAEEKIEVLEYASKELNKDLEECKKIMLIKQMAGI